MLGHSSSDGFVVPPSGGSPGTRRAYEPIAGELTDHWKPGAHHRRPLTVCRQMPQCTLCDNCPKGKDLRAIATGAGASL